MPLNARQKGKRGERLLVQDCKRDFPEFAEDLKRGFQSRQGDDNPDVDGMPGVWWENKFGAKINIKAALAQAERDSRGRRIPIAVIRYNREKPCVYMRWENFVHIVRNGIDALRGKDVSTRRRRKTIRFSLIRRRGRTFLRRIRGG